MSDARRARREAAASLQRDLVSRSMSYPILRNGGGASYVSVMRGPRSGPEPWALSRQLSAVDRRRRLGAQQLELRSGLADYATRPPYPYRPRPPC